MSISPRVLLSIDYEPWFALFRHYDNLTDPVERRNLDGGFTMHAIDPILEQLGDAKASIYLVGEIADWYPDVPQQIVDAGHELGLHCHIHRPLKNVDELAQDIQESTFWRKKFAVRGYRAPMIGIDEAAYQLVRFGPTPVRLLGAGISLAAFLAVIVLFPASRIWLKRKAHVRIF